MKLHALMLAVALAAAGPAMAQSSGPSGSSGSSGSSADAATTDKAPVKVQKKKTSAKSKKGNAHHHHDKHGKAEHRSRAMGAGAASPVTDLNAAGRQDRMEDAYENWRRLQARR